MRDEPPSDPLNPTRRAFLQTTSSTAAVAAFTGYLPVNTNGDPDKLGEAIKSVDRTVIDGSIPITLRINGNDRKLRVDPRTTLLDCIRETVTLTGTKKGCDHGQCGACTVHVNGRRVNSCLTLALMHEG